MLHYTEDLIRKTLALTDARQQPNFAATLASAQQGHTCRTISHNSTAHRPQIQLSRSGQEALFLIGSAWVAPPLFLGCYIAYWVFDQWREVFLEVSGHPPNQHSKSSPIRPPPYSMLVLEWATSRVGPTHPILNWGALTPSLPRVIDVKFLLQPHQKYYITQYGELGFS